MILMSLSFVPGESRLSRHVTQSATGIDGPALELTTEILKQDYCVGDAELDAVRMKLRFTYTNKSKRPLILYKGGLIGKIMVSRDLPAAKANHFEIDASLEQMTSGGEDCYQRTPFPTKCFIVLPPGASYQAEDETRVFVVRDDVREIAGAVKSGDHVLQLEVGTWNESQETAKVLAAQWSSNGVLWDQPLRSLPMPFTVPKQRRVLDCDSAGLNWEIDSHHAARTYGPLVTAPPLPLSFQLSPAKLLIRLGEITNFYGRVRQRRARSAASQPALSALALAPHPHAGQMSGRCRSLETADA